MFKLWVCALAISGLGCGTGERPGTASSPAEPAVAFSALEERLLSAATVQFDFRATAVGAVEADLEGALSMGPGDRVRLTASGRFAGKPVDLLLRAEEEECELGDKANRVVIARPARLKEALLIGLTRMGILHNLARLTTAGAPDHADGGVRDWVTAGAFAGGSGDSGAVSFDLTVAGRPAGSASLEIDSRGRPIVRRQTVHFRSGEMRVVERYSGVRIIP